MKDGVPAARTVIRTRTICAALAIAFAVAGSAAAQTVGVTPRQVTVGTHADLSGPLASWGIAVRNGLQMAFDEVNAKGGVRGRMLRLLVKDDGYDPEKAAEAVKTLVKDDKVFAILSPLGTPTAQAAAKEAITAGVPYLFPLAATENGPPSSPLLFVVTPPVREAVANGLRRLLDDQPGARVAVLASDDSFGRAVYGGAAAELARRGRKLSTVVSFARGTSDFTVPLGWLRQRDIDIVVLGTVGEEVLSVMRDAHAPHSNWHPRFLCSSACYTPEIAALGGHLVDGLYAVGMDAIPYPDDPRLHDWARRYERRTAAVATAQALAAYRNARLFIAALRRAGRTPTRAALVHALETLGPWTDPEIGGPPITFTPTNHLGSHAGFLAQVRGGRWQIIPDPNRH